MRIAAQPLAACLSTLFILAPSTSAYISIRRWISNSLQPFETASLPFLEIENDAMIPNALNNTLPSRKTLMRPSATRTAPPTTRQHHDATPRPKVDKDGLQGIEIVEEDVLAHDRNELRKRDGACGDYHNCGNLGQPALCCPQTALCSADFRGTIGCCPKGSACTGLVSGVVPTTTFATTTTTSGVAVTVSSTGPDSSSVVIIGGSGADDLRMQRWNGAVGGALVMAGWFGFG